MEKVCIDTVQDGKMTKDLALLIHGKKMERKHYLNTQEFLDALSDGLEKALA